MFVHALMWRYRVTKSKLIRLGIRSSLTGARKVAIILLGRFLWGACIANELYWIFWLAYSPQLKKLNITFRLFHSRYWRAICRPE